MNKKGFTLIELLAVIVILAIIALIATPVIMNIITSAKQDAAIQSAKLMVSETQLAYEEAYMKCDGKAPTLKMVMTSIDMDGLNESSVNVTAGTITDGYDTTCTVEANKKVVCTNSKYGAEGKGNINNLTSNQAFELGTCEILD